MQKSQLKGINLCLTEGIDALAPPVVVKIPYEDSLLRTDMKKLVLSLSLVLAFSSATAAFAAIPQKIRIGTDPTYAPFESKNSKGELVGFDIDLANELCKRIKAQCTYVENPLDALIPSLKAKKIDVLCPLYHRKTPAGDCLYGQTLRGRFPSGGGEIV
jgi:hypothetical protein